MTVGQRMQGLETEYALMGCGRKGSQLNREDVIEHIFAVMRNDFPHLFSRRQNGIFLSNASLFYLDCGMHVEIATPECLNPWDVVRYQMAGDRILSSAAKELADRSPDIAEIMFTRCNVDYAHGSDNTWGCHESYLYKGNPGVFPGHLIPHLVSRVIYTGAGGWNSRSPGLEFLLSPRVVHLTKEESTESTNTRGIFHLKDEPLCSAGYHRLHLLCGESLCSEKASVLKIGTTALVAAMIEARLQPGNRVMLRSPLQAMAAFAGDPGCSARAQGKNGTPLSAIDIQRHYLEMAEAHLDASFMPSWAGSICREWRETVEKLEGGAPGSVESELDWALKLSLFKNHVKSKRLSWNDIASWNRVAKRIDEVLVERRRKGPISDSLLDKIVKGRGSIASDLKSLAPFMNRHNLHWKDFGKFLQVRDEVFEIDVRFSQIDDRGIFNSLNSQGLLNHHFEGVDDIDGALHKPPAKGRAHVRGEVVRRLFEKKADSLCEWSGVFDGSTNRVLDLSDPFSREEEWRPATTKELENEELESILGELRDPRSRPRTRLAFR